MIPGSVRAPAWQQRNLSMTAQDSLYPLAYHLPKRQRATGCNEAYIMSFVADKNDIAARNLMGKSSYFSRRYSCLHGRRFSMGCAVAMAIKRSTGNGDMVEQSHMQVTFQQAVRAAGTEAIQFLDDDDALAMAGCCAVTGLMVESNIWRPRAGEAIPLGPS